MAFGLTPKYLQDYELKDLTGSQFLRLAYEAAVQLGWSISSKTDQGYIFYTKMSFSSWGEEVTVTVGPENAHLKSKCTGTQMADWGKNKRNVEALVNLIEQLKLNPSPEGLMENDLRVDTGLLADKEPGTIQPISAHDEKKSGFLSIFKPVDGYFITPILVILNIAIFLLMILSGVDFLQPTNKNLLDWGANFRPLTLEGQWWRLISCCFLHIGLLHLLMNMYALMYIGLLLEPILGKTRFLTAYLLAGLAASIISLNFHSYTISAGASGAIFGMYGVFLAMLTTNLIDKAARKSLLLSIGIFVFYNILNGVNGGGVDNAAHIGGLLTGILIGYAFYPALKNPGTTKTKNLVLAVLALGVIGFTVVIYKMLQNDGVKLKITDNGKTVEIEVPNTADFTKYSEKMENFRSMEEMALGFYHLPDTTPKEKILSELKEVGLYYWDANIKLLKSLENLDLPTKYLERNKLLLRYCELRTQCYTFLYKAIEEETDNYKDSIEIYSKNIEELMDNIK